MTLQPYAAPGHILGRSIARRAVQAGLSTTPIHAAGVLEGNEMRPYPSKLPMIILIILIML